MAYVPPSERKNSLSSWSLKSHGINTPSHTTEARDSKPAHDTASTYSHASSSTFTMSNAVASVPEAGGTYMIRELGSDRVLTILNGNLTVQLNDGTGGGWHWHCEENEIGFIGFRNAVSGRYLGHNNKGGYIARSKKMRTKELFLLRPRNQGGYNLCIAPWVRLKPMGIADEDGPTPKLVHASSYDKAVHWAFVSV
ncbi:hypothetical protein GGS24DRAFT_267648 [Hypoxylon argillaceum]|nr:hypothetical protein GGS24DRAFT_267648 [Hypoxylon argillaceum]